jgi:hypothetical protein
MTVLVFFAGVSAFANPLGELVSLGLEETPYMSEINGKNDPSRRLVHIYDGITCDDDNPTQRRWTRQEIHGIVGEVLENGQDWVMLSGNIEGENNNFGSISIFLQSTGRIELFIVG